MWLKPRKNVPYPIVIGFSDNRIDLATTASDAKLVKGSDSILEEKRRTLCKHVGFGDVCVLRQVHSDRMVRAKTENVQTADAHWTDMPGLNLVIFSADCVPVFLCSTRGDVAAAVHCGWRGLANQILRNVVHKLPVDAADLVGFTGPAICGNCYEVGIDLLPKLNVSSDSSCVRRLDKPKKCLLDLPNLVADQLLSLGVRNVDLSDQCTFHHSERYFSYRRNGTHKRQASFIRIQRDG